MSRCDHLDLSVAHDLRWDFAERYAAEINAHWQRRTSDNPQFFNGPIVLLCEPATVGTTAHGLTLGGRFLKADFKSFLYWREVGPTHVNTPEVDPAYGGAPPASVCNTSVSDTSVRDTGVCDAFGSAIVWSADGKLMVIRQSPGHVNQGQVYFPGGFIDQRDISEAGAIDIDGSVRRELAEETGLTAQDVTRTPGYLVTRNDRQLSIGVTFRTNLPADQLCQKVEAFIQQDSDAELAAVACISQPEAPPGTTFAEFANILVHELLPVRIST
ncbi:MAG: NUDIX hydrolase [Pseudomonadota bacterium]